MNIIRLTRYSAKPMLQGAQHVWPVKIVAEGLNGAPSAIFVYAKAKEGDPLGDEFQCMASVPQLDEISTTGPIVENKTTQVPYYRTNTASFNTRTAEEADEVWQSLLEDAQNLAINLDAAADFQAVAVVEASADGIATQ
jgi:hypothetical protein